MSDGIGVKYGIFGIFDINDAFGIRHFSPKLAYLMTHPELEYRTFILGMNALQAQGSPDVKLFAKRV